MGPAGHWAEVLTHFTLDLGFSTFVLVAPPDRDTLTTFIEDVARGSRTRSGTADLERVSTTSVFEDRPETARGRMLYRTLLAIHALIRRDLETVEQLAGAFSTDSRGRRE